MKLLKLNLLPISENAHGTRIGREAFLYMDPPDHSHDHGQCCSCWKWTGHEYETCVILGKMKVPGSASCCLYEYGNPNELFAGHEQDVYSPVQVGFVNRPVRCENCIAFVDNNNETGKCNLFAELNKKLPNLFSLNETVHRLGCCNANTPKPTAQADRQHDQAQ